MRTSSRSIRASPRRSSRPATSATIAEIDEAVALALAAQRDWASQPASVRAEALFAAAAWLRARGLEVAALEVRECAKPWPEADADVCEAIDYLEYYGRAAIDLERSGGLLQVPGEHNELVHRGRGVAAVIAPWNFPVAIPMGMTVAALAAGNAALLKPAEQSPACGAAVVEALRSGRCPRRARRAPSRSRRGRRGARRPPGGGDDRLHWIARCRTAGAAQRGGGPPGPASTQARGCGVRGKELCHRRAGRGPRRGGASHRRFRLLLAGQKCSAASRVLVAERLAGQLLERLAGVSLLVVGPARELTTEVPPVIDQAALERVASYAALCRDSGEVLAEVAVDAPTGYYAPPLLVSGLPAESPVLREEIFGPILAVERFGEIDEALARVDQLPFALTAGLFSRDPAVVARVAESVPAGNLYVNRAITGAMVGRQPFGGNRLSGNGSKAGGADYLRHFVDPKVRTENTMRHGLVV